MAKLRGVAFVMAAVMLTACGTDIIDNPFGDHSVVARAGYCPPSTHIDGPDYVDYALELDWVPLDEVALDELRESGTFDGHELGDSTTTRLGDVPSATHGWIGMSQDAGIGSLLIGEPTVLHPISVGLCGINTSRYLQSVIDPLDPQSFDELLDIMGDMDAASTMMMGLQRIKDERDAQRAWNNRPWSERDPRERAINPTDVPVDVELNIQYFSVDLIMPTAEVEQTAVVLGQYIVDVGLGDGYPLYLLRPDPDRPGMSQTDISISVEPGGSVELYGFIEVSDSPNKELGALTVLSAEELVALDANGMITIEFAADGDSVRIVSVSSVR